MKDEGTDLFGQVPEHTVKTKSKRLGPYQQWKIRNNYRIMNYLSKSVCCGTCLHHRKVRKGNTLCYKCEFLGDTDSTATDIRLSNVCDRWEREV